MSIPGEIMFIALLLLEIVSFQCPVFDAAPANPAALAEDRCIPDYILKVEGAYSTQDSFSKIRCGQLLPLNFFPNCSNLSNMAFVTLAAAKIPLVLLEAGCASTGPFDCSMQANVPMTVTGIVLLGNEESPILLMRKTDYHLLYRGIKNPCVAAWCGAERSTCFDPSALPRRKTRGRNALRKRQPGEFKYTEIHDRKSTFASGAIIAIVLFALVLLLGLPYMASLCIKSISRRDEAHQSLLESSNKQRSQLLSQKPPTVRADETTTKGTDYKSMQSRSQARRSTETQTPNQKHVNDSCTQTDDNVDRMFDEDYTSAKSRDPDQPDKASGIPGVARAEETTKKIKSDITVTHENVDSVFNDDHPSVNSRKPDKASGITGVARAEETGIAR